MLQKIYLRLVDSLYYNKNKLVMILLTILALLTVIPYVFALLLLHLCMYVNIRAVWSPLEIVEEARDFIIEPYIFWQQNITMDNEDVNSDR